MNTYTHHASILKHVFDEIRKSKEVCCVSDLTLAQQLDYKSNN